MQQKFVFFSFHLFVCARLNSFALLEKLLHVCWWNTVWHSNRINPWSDSLTKTDIYKAYAIVYSMENTFKLLSIVGLHEAVHFFCKFFVQIQNVQTIYIGNINSNTVQVKYRNKKPKKRVKSNTNTMWRTQKKIIRKNVEFWSTYLQIRRRQVADTRTKTDEPFKVADEPVWKGLL